MCSLEAECIYKENNSQFWAPDTTVNVLFKCSISPRVFLVHFYLFPFEDNIVTIIWWNKEPFPLHGHLGLVVFLIVFENDFFHLSSY